ncbi:DUF6365 family protein [Microbispora sp. NBRC 16548]|uniref:DUF6365 family protein n=1 Tax=Microbispora sp. NBRC 16548 TaxID=3030994 RepID=UPI0024A46DD5|nr:DUF6365 family protein [Microbispora sp. NBRC 16548]GLX05358.1 hypothetical protein Misp03_22850 [Microbispora sp. NBRC 16548]
MKLLHFSLPVLGGYGETFVGLSLADQLADGGVQNHFVTTKAVEPLFRAGRYPFHIIDGDARPVERFVDEVIKDVRPDAIVLADYTNFWGHMVRSGVDDPWFIEKHGVPLLPIDMWEWENTVFAYDFCGRGWGREYDRHILDMDVHLRPVPIAHLDPGPSGRGYPYRIVAPEPGRDERTRAKVFAELGLSPNDRLVLIPVSSWQQPKEVTRQTTDMMVRLGERVPELLAHYLRQLPDSTHVVVVGPMLEPFTTLPAERLHVLAPTTPDRYHALLSSADLLLSLSMNAVTLARAVLMGTPGMLLTNRFTLTDEQSVAGMEQELGGLSDTVRSWLGEVVPIDPFRHWPKGLYHFVEPLVQGNEYLTAMAHEQLFDEKAVVEGMRGILYEPAVRERLAEAQSRYVRLVDDLPPTHEVIRAAVGKLGIENA